VLLAQVKPENRFIEKPPEGIKIEEMIIGPVIRRI
jgi:hypothetical protein